MNANRHSRIFANKINDNSRFRRRENWVFSAMFLLIFAFFCRIVALQVFGYRVLQKKAKKEHLTLVELPAFRGTILDRKGRELAVSLPTRSIYLSPKILSDPENVVKVFTEELGVDGGLLRKKIRKNRNFVWVKRQVEGEDYARIKKLHLPGVGFCKEFKRVYPKGVLASHILGFVNIDGKGLEGIERRNDELLKGESGWYILIRDARGRTIPSLERKRKKVREGLNLVLTIDERIQEIVEEELEKVYKKFNASSATAIVMEPFSGEILGLANRPTFNPNSPGAYPPDFRRNRAITDIFEPGSVFKAVIAAAALEEGVVDPKEIIFCENGKWRVYGKHILHDHKPHKNLSFREVIAKSSNIGTVKVALRLGKKRVYQYARNFGFGERTGVDLPAEIRGILRPPKKWSKYSMAAIPIGQEIGATPIQAICALAAIANGGSYVRPHLLKEIKNSQGRVIRKKVKPERRRVISRRTAMTLTSILRGVVEEEGTAPLAKVYNYSVAGKTGTSQKVVDGRYSHSKFFSSFIGYAPAENPKVIVLVMVDEPKPLYYGSLVAAPAFREITRRVLSYLEVPYEESRKVSSAARLSAPARQTALSLLLARPPLADTMPASSLTRPLQKPSSP